MTNNCAPALVPTLVFAMAVGCAPAADRKDVAGAGNVSGVLDGRAFDTVGAVYLIGAPDDPAQTTVIYVFDAPVACSALAEPGWDTRITDDSQALEMKLIGTAPASFPIAPDGRPSAGQCDVNYTVTSTTATPTEVSARSGAVVLSALEGGKDADGTFDLTFASGSVSGSFHGSFCADGHEP